MMTIYKQQWRNERHSAIVACQTILQSVLLSVFMCQVSLRSVEITSEFLEDGLLCRSVTLEVVALLHLFERCLLLLCQSLWNIHADVYHKISSAMSVALYRRQSLAPETERLARLRARFNLYLHFAAADGRHLNLSAESCRREVKEQVVDEVLFFADEGVARFFLYEHLNVAGHTVVYSSVAFSRHVYHHATGHTGRNLRPLSLQCRHKPYTCS